LTTTTSQLDPTLAVTLARPGRLRSRLFKSVLALVLLGAAPPISLLVRPWTGSNLGIVEPGRVIRAAQPTTQLPQLIQEFQLTSILNLRGGSSKDWWYTAEVQTAQSSGVAFYDLPLSATKRPTRRDLLLLIDTLDRCKYPLLIHCKAGADRTGLATAIYLMMHRGEPPRQALRAFTIYHSHVPLFGTEHLHEPLDEYASWLDAKSLAHSPDRFRNWVKDEYQADDPSIDPPHLAPGPRHRV
jgi:protein tyrosine phosphatase (PTP) superfamily phosphohydrolase (DUF442 family)